MRTSTASAFRKNPERYLRQMRNNTSRERQRLSVSRLLQAVHNSRSSISFLRECPMTHDFPLCGHIVEDPAERIATLRPRTKLKT